jgi:ribosomal protein S18 acetylase RimI-like enzyme
VSTASFRDREGRCLRIATLGAGPCDDERAPLETMYDEYDTADRAQGLPPAEEDALAAWLDSVLEGSSVLAWDDDRVVGHAGLYPVEADRHELVIFVAGDYQGARVGTELLSQLLSAHRERGGGTVQLSVESGNQAAISLYQKFGFEIVDETVMEIGMHRDV